MVWMYHCSGCGGKGRWQGPWSWHVFVQRFLWTFLQTSNLVHHLQGRFSSLLISDAPKGAMRHQGRMKGSIILGNLNLLRGHGGFTASHQLRWRPQEASRIEQSGPSNALPIFESSISIVGFRDLVDRSMHIAGLKLHFAHQELRIGLLSLVSSSHQNRAGSLRLQEHVAHGGAKALLLGGGPAEPGVTGDLKQPCLQDLVLGVFVRLFRQI
mmetsp:Transcript_45163/g.71756  ORF Transcript_45163/g.71756 Transcript_45163/m.71756 type:complete len:212 (+) Transcript_45163:382-1017(+)